MSVSGFHSRESALDPLIYAISEAQRADRGYRSLRLATVTDNSPLQVMFDGEVTSSGQTYKSVNDYWPNQGDRVLMGQVGSGWVCLGKLGDVPAWGAFPGTGGTVGYGTGFAAPFWVIKHGWVECTGLLKNNGSFGNWVAGTILGHFTAGWMLPEDTHICTTTGNDFLVTLNIQGRSTPGAGIPAGQVQVRNGITIASGGWISLNGLRWPISGRP